MELPRPGEVLLGKYVLDRKIGEGGMGVVYAARHELLAQSVAVKFLKPEAIRHGEAVARFIREARTTARIESEHVARVLDVGMLHDALPYMVLEFLDGMDLADLIATRGPLPLPTVADYLLQAIDALAHAHALGVVHRDLKPSNLFLARRQDGSERIKVLDFGISKVKSGLLDSKDMQLTRSNALLGTPLFMAPEQLRNAKDVDHRADIWALGVIAYQLLTGVPPFNADNAVALFAAIQESDAPSLRGRRPDLSRTPEIEAAIQTCLRRAPEERFVSVTDLGCVLARFGTRVGARALENAKRALRPSDPFASRTLASLDDSSSVDITGLYRALPVADGAESPPISSTLPSLLADSGERPTLHAEAVQDAPTPKPWSSQNDAGLQSRGPRAPVLVYCAAALALVAAALGLFARDDRSDRAATASTPPPPATTNAVATPVVELPAATPPPPSSTSPAPPPREESAANPARPASARRSLRARPPPSSAAKLSSHDPAHMSCNPPYVVDETGKRTMKLECE